METDPKPQPYTFDLGHLLCTDANPLPQTNDENREAVLAATAQQCARSLIHQLLTACPIHRSQDDGSLVIKLPDPSTELPREKPVPKEKEKTTWEKFAEKKGIKNKKRDGKLKFDEERKEWAPRYGYKGKGAEQGDWLVEVDEKAERAAANGEGEGGKRKKQKKR